MTLPASTPAPTKPLADLTADELEAEHMRALDQVIALDVLLEDVPIPDYPARRAELEARAYDLKCELWRRERYSRSCGSEPPQVIPWS